MSPDRPAVCVFGGSDCAPGSDTWRIAAATGAVIAQLGYTLVNGGYGGSMEASARGAKEAGGRTFAVTCEVWSPRPNDWIDDFVSEPDVLTRARTLIELGTGGYVALPGGTGTLVELATVWELLCKRLMPARPLACVGDCWRPVVEAVAAEHPQAGRHVTFVGSTDALTDCFGPVEL